MEAWNGDGELVCDTCGWPEITPSEARAMFQAFVDDAYSLMGVCNRGRGRCMVRPDRGMPGSRARVRVHPGVAGREEEFLGIVRRMVSGAWSLELSRTRLFIVVAFW
jgi:hypothetical protein